MLVGLRILRYAVAAEGPHPTKWHIDTDRSQYSKESPKLYYDNHFNYNLVVSKRPQTCRVICKNGNSKSKLPGETLEIAKKHV